ncbi:DUF4198 domain-containing protein [uncultured Desulfobacter sp.]|uniref:DUF4198 domain-containing protein n=1 Tax=uncultured Desulfobacter sp. TaxID=240139 RepID=UPI002AAB2F74|nr:DUF4198 domain-containing protein [uncultured Desulfobacter sp.]
MNTPTNDRSRLSRLLILLPATALICFMASSAFSHTLYIQPTRFLADTGKSFPLFFCYGHYIPVADGIRGSKLNRVQVIPPGGNARTIQIRNETGLHSYMVEYDKPGIWGLIAETTPGYYTVFKDKNGKQRHAIKSMDKIKDRASEVTTSYYAKQYAKAYVKCGEAEGSFPGFLGLPLELVPVKDPFTLKPGDTLKMDVYMDGKPYTGEGTWDATFMGYSTLAEDNFYPHTTVKGTRISIPLPHPGRWFIRYAVKTDAPEQDKDKYMQMKLSASLTLQIDNQLRTPCPDSH